MVVITLVIHDAKLHPVLLLDNERQGALNYYDDLWTRQLTTGSSAFEFSVYKKTLLGDNPLNHKYHALNDQAFVSFVHKGKVQLFNIMQVEEKETTIHCFCENLNLELLNEYCNPYKATKAMSFEEYLVQFDILNWGALTIGINEVKDKKLTLEWTGQDTKLARLLSIANNFDAEVEFETQLHNNHTFKAFIINIYKEYEEGKSYGVGRDRSDVVLRYQKNVTGITKKLDKRQIYNAIRPYGKKTVKGERVISNPATRKVTKTVGSNRTYLGGDLKYYDHTIKKANVQAIINYAVQYNILPSGIITQLYLESFWGDSTVGRRDNNWAGMTGGARTRPSGVKVTTGMARPANEGGTYMHYASVDDFLKDYTYLLAKQGIYNVVGKKNLADYTKGLFRAGGAKYDYAAAGYQSYTNLMTNIRNGINKASGNILNTIDTLWQTPVKPITAVKVARRATKTIQAINEATKLKGRKIGSGQCYALSAWYANKLSGPGLGGGVTGIRGRTGAGMAAALIGTDYNWGSYGWKVDKSPNAGNLKAGGIYNVRANRGAPFYTTGWGHTGIIKSVSKTRVTVLEQNFAGRMYVVENSYDINSFASGLQTVCYPREIAQGMSVNGATTQRVTGGTQISYEEVVQEAQTESYEEEQIIYIDNSIYKEWKDENGKVEYYLKNGFLYAPLSRDRYPSVLTGNETRDNWIRKDMEVETDSQDVLISTALKDLKAHAYPAVTYEFDGYVDLELGDVVRIQDDGYEPPLILTARVTEQEISITNPSSNKTKFSNFVEKESQLASDLISDMLRLYDESIPYEIQLATSNGVAFKNDKGESELTATLEKNGKEYDAVFLYKTDGRLLGTGPSLIVKATDFKHVLNVTVEAYINEELVASTQVSFTDTEDGVGVKSTKTTYAESDNGTTPPDNSAKWTEDIPNVEQGKFLWGKTTYTYTNGKTSDVHMVTRMGKDGLPADFKEKLEKRIKEVTDTFNQKQKEFDERNQKELEEFRDTLKNLALPEEAIKKITESIKVDDIPSIKQSFDDLKNKVSETSETSRLNAEIIGTDGKTRYNKNLLVGDPNRTKTYDQDYIEVEANDGGFKRGETYTISFSQTCELLKKVAITLTQANNKGVKLVLTPTKAKMDAQTFEVTKDKQSIEVYPLSYTGVLTGDWYKSKQIDLNASDTQDLALGMVYREVVDGDNATITGQWSDSPQIILDGGN
ncbi:glucosaminidase domain-containing protein [Streptococcus agalactiae]|uniref:glucosaminidase domain-containing protein n=1 Tax=Streptococcus agalactiae TaxID=1311 RepID=UPI000332E1A8|nr:glucosaminidase domain-containing protein [Streptococcus agalactiae]QBX20724.1 tail fibers protein [Streptococcus phage Javan53]CCW39634.1 Phage tail fibers [Streptococcus agalactiae ILRI005]